MEDIIELTNDLAATGTSFEFWGRRTVPKRNVTLVLLNPSPPVIEIPRKRNIEIIFPDNDTQTDESNSLKDLKGKSFPSEMALFDALVEAGVSTLGSYCSEQSNYF